MKKIYQFHYILVNNHYTELMTTGETIIKSPFLLSIFNDQYVKSNEAIKAVSFNSDKYDNFAWSGTSGFKRHRYENLKYIFKLINSGRIDINNVKQLLSEWPDHDITSEQVDILFNKSADKQTRMTILDTMSAKNAAKCSIISQTFRCYKKYCKVYTDFSSLT